ncbi:MAG: glycerate kinase [Burkholderiales bacterium]|nr:glycerate kinase [Burkholderiales bacterium]
MATQSSETSLLLELYKAAIAAAQPAQCLPKWLPSPPTHGRTIVVGAGKASAAMASVLESHWSAPLDGLVLTRRGYAMPCRQIEIVEAGHPIPDEDGYAAAQRIMERVSGLTEHDLVICLLSGGGSALLTLPAAGITLDDKRAITGQLLKAGATIHEINCVRKHLSASKGGRLALTCAPARVVTLLISDVAGDALDVIASGPTVADPTSCQDALDVLARYGVQLRDEVRLHLSSGRGETPKPGADFPPHQIHMLATPQTALHAAAARARELGLTPYILADDIEGESRDVAQAMGAIARRVALHGEPFQRPCVLLSGGETTVTVTGTGRGGPNGEFALALALALKGQSNVWALAADTDGVDGSENNAGAFVTPVTLTAAQTVGLDARRCLDANDSYRFFDAIGGLLVTGPSYTNVNDFRAVLIT